MRYGRERTRVGVRDSSRARHHSFSRSPMATMCVVDETLLAYLAPAPSTIFWKESFCR